MQGAIGTLMKLVQSPFLAVVCEAARGLRNLCYTAVGRDKLSMHAATLLRVLQTEHAGPAEEAQAYIVQVSMRQGSSIMRSEGNGCR